MTEAKTVLTDSRPNPRNDPQWYDDMMGVALGLGWEAAEVSRLVEQGASLEPLYQYTYTEAARYLTPRWHGEPGDWERFADQVADQVGGRQGAVIYGHIALQMSVMYGPRAFFAENHVSWERLKQSLADREALYGVDLYTLNAMSMLATFLKDKEVARDLFTRIGPRWEPAVWHLGGQGKTGHLSTLQNRPFR